MSGSIKILIVENSVSDVEFLQDELKNGGFDYVSEIVQNESAYCNALEVFGPDIILSDFVLPVFSGDAAFEIKKQLAPDTPFIFVSGTIGEERSVEYIKKGVTDYVLKDKLYSLNVKIERALEDVKARQLRNKTADDLRKSELLFRALIEKSTDIKTLTSKDGEFLYCSPSVTQILGYAMGELLHKSPIDFIHPNDLPGFSERRNQTLDNPGRSFFYQLRLRHKNGKWIWCEGTTTNLLHEPAINAMVSNFKDISDRKLAENELNITNNSLKRALNDFEKIMDSSLDMICSIDAEGKFVKVSSASERILGFSPAELTGKRYMDLVYDEDILITGDAAAGIINGHSVTMFENRYIHKTGATVPIIWSATWDDNDKLMYCIAKDATEKKTAENNLFNSESRLKEAQAIARTGNFEMDMVSHSETWSDEMFTILGIVKEEAAPSLALFLSFIHPDDREHVKTGFEECLKTLTSNTFDFRIIRKDGTTRYGHTEGRFELDRNQKPSRYFGIFQDVTERKLAEMERVKMVNDLIVRNNDLEQFAYIISHNLRAPVANIIGASGILTDPDLNVEDRDILGRGINASVIKIDDVIKDLNHILQVKNETGGVKEMVYFSKLVDDIKVSIKDMIDKNDIEIKCDFDEIDTFLCLKPYLHSIFYNLILNSIKYRRQATHCIIEIKSRLVKNMPVLTFTDNGMGINLIKNGSEVFGLYKRFHASIEGKGMGLFISKTQVEMLGGKISIQSIENEGTVFKIEFEGA